MSNYENKLRKVFEYVEAQSQYLLTHKAPLTRRLFTDIAGCGRDFANMIHDMPNIWTGMASQAAIAAKLKNVKFRHSEDHYNSRQRGGEELVLLINKRFGQGKSPSFKEVKAIIDKYCQVHYVTKEENNKLRHIMEAGKSWEQAYKEGGVLLTNARELFTKRGRHSDIWKGAMKAKYQNFIKKKKR